MDDNYHKPGLYRWKRQEDSRVYSRSQNTKTKDDIQNWIKTVEDASNRAAEQVFGTGSYGGRAKGKAVAKATREYMKEDEQAYSEAQDLLSQWMEEKVHLQSHLDPEIEARYDDEDWTNHEIQLDVKREWDNLLADNYEEYGLPLSSRQNERHITKDIYNMDEEDAVAMVMQGMMDKPVVKKGFKKDLGMDKWAKQKDPKTKMDVRQKQVKENREKREEELKKRRQDQQMKKETMSRAKQLVMREEQQKQLQVRREEMEIRKEMAKIRKEMQTDRKQIEEKKAKARHEKESLLLAAKVKVAADIEAESLAELEDQKRQEERQRLLTQRLRELEAREAANNLKVLHRHFSAWYNVVLDRRLKMGKARAMYDWKLLLRGWNAWRSFVREQRMERETRAQEVEVITTQRNQQIAERHSRQVLLRKYFVAWQVWVRGEQDRRDLEQAQKNTRNKMMNLLEAAASGKLWNKEEEGPSTAKFSARESTQLARERQKKSTAEKIHSMFEGGGRREPPPDTPLSTDRSSVSSASGSHHTLPQSRIPTEPWQVTRKHLNLTPGEMEELGAEGEPTCSPEEMNAKVLKKYGRQPWHKKEVSTYEHRHATQRKILEEQKRQIKEQQRLIEDLQFKTTHTELQKQLVEQKLTLQNIAQQVEKDHKTADKCKGSENETDSIKSAKNTQPPRKPPSTKPTANHSQSEESQRRCKSASAIHKTGKTTEKEPDTDRTATSTNRTTRPSSARTDVSRPSSYTSTTSEKSKYLQVLKNMEERTAERARSKAEREEKRRQAEEDKLAKLEAIEEAKRKEEEEEKRRKAEQYRERKKLEKQREAEKLQRDEKLRQQNEMADQHFLRSLLKYRGLLPMLKLVAMAKQNKQMAKEHHKKTLQRRTLLAWHEYTQEQWAEKRALADQMNNFLCVKHCYQSWRLYKHHMVIEEHKAKQHFEQLTKTKVFQAWRDYANEEKVASWEKDRRAREHYSMLVLRRHFRAWRQLPEAMQMEEERARRRAELREKVASILPDFEVSQSVDASLDFTL